MHHGSVIGGFPLGLVAILVILGALCIVGYAHAEPSWSENSLIEVGPWGDPSGEGSNLSFDPFRCQWS